MEHRNHSPRASPEDGGIGTPANQERNAHEAILCENPFKIFTLGFECLNEAAAVGSAGQGSRAIPTRSTWRSALLGLSNRLESQARLMVGSQLEPCLAMALSMVSSLRMQATRATFFRLPAARSRS